MFHGLVSFVIKLLIIIIIIIINRQFLTRRNIEPQHPLQGREVGLRLGRLRGLQAGKGRLRVSFCTKLWRFSFYYSVISLFCNKLNLS